MKYPANKLPTTLVLMLACMLVIAAIAVISRQDTQSALSAVPRTQADIEEAPTASPVPSPVREVFADCGWAAETRAFIDANENGKWDTGEQPLPGVSFHVDDVLNDVEYIDYVEAVSDSSGRAKLSVWLPGCPDVELEVYAVAPSGYVPTTAPRMPWDGKPEDEPFVFGFKWSNTSPGMPGTGHP